MTRALSLLSFFSCFCGVVFLSSCDDAPAGKKKAGGPQPETSHPPLQKAIYLRSKGGRAPGTTFTNSATLTMADANLTVQREDVNLPGTATMIMRELWNVEQVSPKERTFTIEEHRELNAQY